jgi:PAS domain S-box-containing protein
MTEKLAYEELEQRINELEEAHKTLQEEEKILREILDNASDAIFLMRAEPGKEGPFIEVNNVACQRLGYSRDEFRSMLPRDIMDELLAHSEFSRIEAELSSQGQVVFETTEVAKNGTRIPVEVSACTLKRGKKNMWIAISRDISERKRVEKDKENLILELQKTLLEVKTLRGILPICSSCKKIRDDKGYWNQVEVYVRDHTEATFSHSICPECAKRLYPDLDLFRGRD